VSLLDLNNSGSFSKQKCVVTKFELEFSLRRYSLFNLVEELLEVKGFVRMFRNGDVLCFY